MCIIENVTMVHYKYVITHGNQYIHGANELTSFSSANKWKKSLGRFGFNYDFLLICICRKMLFTVVGRWLISFSGLLVKLCLHLQVVSGVSKV